MTESHGPQVSIVMPVLNGADTLSAAAASVLAQTHADLELVISDNASTDGTQEVCRELARHDERVVYQRHGTTVGLLDNFASGARRATGRYVRYLGDDDWLTPDYVSRVLARFTEDPRRVVVTTQMVYRDGVGRETLEQAYDPRPMSAADGTVRFAAMLRLLTAGYATIDPCYSMMRRELATVSRHNMLREDQVFAARLALAGPWGHVAAPLAGRRREEGTASGHARLLGVPGWHRHVRVLLQCRELDRALADGALDQAQRRSARAEILRFYARSKQVKLHRGVAKLGRLVQQPARLPAGEAP